MSFNVNDQLTINGVTYRVAEHPAAPGFPYGQEGRAGIVYQLLPSPTGRAAGGEGAAALKVFKPRFRSPALLTQAEKLAAFAHLPGLQAAHRIVLTRAQHPDLIQQHPDLIYAALMPWIDGPTWLDVLLAKQPLPAQQALALAHSLAEALEAMELRGIAHCDLSAANLILPLLAGGSGIALVDLEGLFAPGLSQPQTLSSGSAGYAHAQAAAGLWSPNADRFAGAVLLAEMLGWCAPEVTQAAWGESYFDPQEMQQDSARYQALLAALQRHWGDAVARLFARAWHSETLADCPTFGEWLLALPEHPVAQAFSLSTPAAETTAGEQPTSPQESAAVDATAEIRAFMQAARRMEDKGNLEGALALYRQALELAGADPSLRSLAREIELTVQDVEKRVAAQPSRPQPAISPLPMGEGPGVRSIPPLPPREGPGVRAEPRRTSPWGWVVAGLMIFALFVAIVVNLQQQQAAQATATAIAWQEQSTATARAQATATAQAQATVTARAAQATATVQVPQGFCDLFNNPIIDPRWKWIDPLGGSKAYIENKGLTIETVGGKRDIYGENLNAPRLLQRFSAEDFSFQTLVTIRPNFARDVMAFQGGGLILFRDDANYVWIAIGTSMPEIDSAFAVNGKRNALAWPEHKPLLENPSAYLRIERKNNRVSAAYSLDGKNWIESAPINFPSGEMQAGLVLFSAWDSPGFWAHFDSFLWKECVEGISSRSITVEVFADKGWQNTGVELIENDQVTVEYISGKWTNWIGHNQPYDGNGPPNVYICAQWMDANKCMEPIPTFPAGTLIGRVGQQLIGIGNRATFITESAGILELRMNDGDDGLYDNEGYITVQITVQSP
jgi:regulation of enolase protein 1 (concanavalin A-like superfamily)